MLGNLSIKAPIAVAKTPIAPMVITNAFMAATATKASGATRDILNKTSPSVLISIVIAIALVIAASMPSMSFNIPTNANNGTAIAVSATTPANADGTNVPIIVSGISINVKAPANTTSAFTFSVARSTPSMSFNIPTNAKRGTAIVVRAKTPEIAYPITLPIMDSGINNNVIAVVRPTKASTVVTATSTPFIKRKTPTKANKGMAIDVKARAPFNDSPILTLIVDKTLVTPDIANINVESATADPIALPGSTFRNR